MSGFNWRLAAAVWSVAAAIGVTGGVLLGMIQDALTG